MAGLIVAPCVKDVLDVPAALPPQPLTGRHSTKNLRALGRKLCWPETDDRTSPLNLRTSWRNAEVSKLHVTKIVVCLLLKIYKL
jgi:hypothetical protein